MTRPSLFTIPPHRSFSDALAAGLLARFGGEPTGLARGIVLLPNNRAARAVSDAFVRRAGGGLLLPRLVPIGDPELDERIGGALDPLGAEPIPPALDPTERQMRLGRLVQRHRGVDAAEALRLAGDLGRTLDQLIIEEVAPARLRDIAADLPDLAVHWQSSLATLELILRDWPAELAKLGRIDLAERRNRLLAALERRWRAAPPAAFICAAGITTSAPAVARLLRRVALLEQGMVVLPALDLAMPDDEWEMLGPLDGEGGRQRRAAESHPQFHLKLLLDRMGFARHEVEGWRWGGGRDAPAVRSRAIGNAMAPPEATAKWAELKPAERRLSGVRALELADPAEEAQAIAIALREALEIPGKTAALVTPDRKLARRVSAHLKRWGIEADDSAGRPLSQTPPGTLLLAIAAAAVERFAPVPLLTLLNHPLVRQGEARLPWLDGVRLLDLALRGPRPAAGLSGVSAHLSEGEGRAARKRRRALPFWEEEARALLQPLEDAAQALADDQERLWHPRERAEGLGQILASIRETAGALAGDGVWRGPAGRAAAELLAALEDAAVHGPERVEPASLPALLERIMDGQAVRPPFGQHPRLFIWGLLEARLQQADLMILAGLNEGTWPAAPAPDPWLAPRIRADLGLPSLERRIGLAAHDFACGIGARQVLVTRARRDARSPAIASRFWLRIEAMTGGVTREPNHGRWAKALDRPAAFSPAARPAPAPAAKDRPRLLYVTDVDRLKADPYAFYAKRMLRLAAFDPADADPTAAWRGTAVHAVLEAWMKEDECDPARLRPRAEALLDDPGVHPMLRALWQPRLMEAIDFIAAEMANGRSAGRRPMLAEKDGKTEIAGIELHGIADRIDRCGDEGLAIVDYKTGKPPSRKAVDEGFSLQLGLLGLIAERGGFPGADGRAERFEYWSLAKDKGKFGYVVSADLRSGMAPGDFVASAAARFTEAADKWLTGAEPFTAKLHPAYAPYGDYDQLMRLDEWYGREE
ncbi:double-strand break repair protein AddB [Sphingosinicella sp. YJ22]|uniref:double-strand break repair protein AddB n=1 Tax=Sphingosinicella sp. YJ22 TaxID=1104780 RepID=UPI00140E2217|nr:double-strand break repair protein AddB [Sphingosinicella sp. YJ22]